MKTRILTSVVIIAVMTAVLCLSGTVVYPIALSVLAVMATFEILRVFGMEKSYVVSIPAYAVSGVMPLLAYVMSELMRRPEYEFVIALALVLFVLMLYLFVVAVFSKGALKFSSLSSVQVMVIYVASAFSALSIINCIDGIGLFCVGMVLIGAWISDVMAYFSGYFFGKHKLIPEVSPKKTIEGSIGAVIGTGLTMLLYGLIVSLVTDLTPNYLVLAISGPILSLIGQIGDLFASLLKREHGIKDYGNLMPGHGGIMDRFDSILAVACATMIIVLTAAPFA